MEAPGYDVPPASRYLRRVIRGVQYQYDRVFDVIAEGDPVYGPLYDRTQVSTPVDLCVELTTQCNFACRNCFSESARGLAGRHARAATIREHVEAGANETIRVCVTGGEPLLHPDVASVLELPARLPELGFVLSTNGTARRDLDGLIRDHRWLVALSLHGTKRRHDAYTATVSWDRVVRRAQALASTNVVHFYCVLSDDFTEADALTVLRTRDEVGAAFVRFILPRPGGRFTLLQRGDVVDGLVGLLDGRAALKTTASRTHFLSAAGLQRATR